MTCAWKELLEVLPKTLREQVDSLGRESMQELRLRLDKPALMKFSDRYITLPGDVNHEQLDWVVSAASRYSPWRAESAKDGFLTAPGGHRIGICGEAVVKNGAVTGMKRITSLCIRVARDYPGIGTEAAVSGSVLIIGPPGWGKTTLLRDVARLRSAMETVAVVDDRGELFPEGIERGERMDVLSLCPKREGVEMALRTLGPEVIAVDEITAEEDCAALIKAANCGVRLLAAAHAESVEDMHRSRLYRHLLENRIFDTLVRLRRDQTYTVERMASCNTNGSVLYW